MKALREQKDTFIIIVENVMHITGKKTKTLARFFFFFRRALQGE
jgi:hypothetical protein